MSKELSGNTKTLVETYLVPMLNGLEDIEIHDEVGRLREDDSMDTVEFSFQNWNSDFTPTVIKNATELTETTDYIVDYDNGTLQMTSAFVVGDTIRASYRFEFFNLHTLANFYSRALSFFNGLHPKTSYTLDNTPDAWADALTEYAYKYCLQSIMLTAASWRGKLVFPDSSAVINVCSTLIGSVSSNLQARMQNIKGRALLTPRSISSGRWRAPRTVTGTNWQEFTAVGVSG